ncbi:DNA recombination protein RmuC [Hyphomicrobium sulfonivorans]|uniref:DNA recombination protein RmuC homolog n=1 Tax=Hyphomicrobium sulfonivorans TaxID=121290 RepID=A0A109BJX1_HYPSL|nr:DNA recombination protein RmuC [Hyphomicrobium sulfonivorans]KWT70059.1 DNA recombination protein RmuC [Hyphomicrobium sulfonivorans]
MLERLQSIDIDEVRQALENALADVPQVAFYAIGGAIAFGALVLLLRAMERSNRARTDAAHAAAQEAAQVEFAELKGRLSAIAEFTAQQNAEQVRALNDRLDGMARHLAQTLDVTSARLGDNLNEAGRRTSESLSTLNERLALIDQANRSLADLSSEVVSLQSVLANKQARGAFGQMRMETIVRDALPARAYDFQPTLSNGKRPDCVIRLPNAEALVVDSKFPLEGFEALRVAQSAEQKRRAYAAIREAVGRHIAAISEKYLIPGETQETALMFVPSESICAELFEKFPDLVQGAHRARIMIVAPNTLMLAVQTVQALLKDAKMRDHADVIQREVGLLLTDVGQLVERVSDLERHFTLSRKSLDKVTAATSKILGRRERLSSLDLEAMEGSGGNGAAMPELQTATVVSAADTSQAIIE